MQITRLELNNFSSYEGINTFDFSVEHQKPIILIGGQNGAGKTSLFTAIKIALYGPLAFGYTGNNSFYSKKIKGLINHKAFQFQDFISGVSVDIKQKRERAVVCYRIKRNWKIRDSKIEEEYAVYEDGRELDESEKILFESYILSIIPLELFEFFLFDGEEIGNIFSADTYNKFLKKAILTMCGIDDLEILQNFCSNYTGSRNGMEEQVISEKYTFLEHKLADTDNRLEKCIDTISSYEKEKEELTVLIEQKQAEFIRSGGISKEVSAELEEKASKLDKKRENINHDIKTFFEELLPFIIMKDMIPSLKMQSRYEEKAAIYDYVRNMLSEKFIAELLDKYAGGQKDSASAFYEAVIKKFEVSGSVVDDMIFGFSESERGKIFHLASLAEDYNKNELVENIKKKETLYKETTLIRQRLRNALSEEDAKKYTDEISNANHRIELLEMEINQKCLELEALKIERESTEKELAEVKEKIRGMIQDKHVLELTGNISAVMNELISASMKSICNQLGERIVRNLKEIYRKDNLISAVKVSEDFRFDLYQNQHFSFDDLRALFSNIGKKEFCKLFGDESVKMILSYLCEDNIDDLENALNEYDGNKELELLKKIDLNMLSKGERQIFILSLYWAIVQVSEKQIPFVIDTPYARIDANHRGEISAKFFPNISKQVIILSTDEEITKEYYDIIRPYISREYLLENNKGDNRTIITDGYFFKEDEI